mgnify:CR=1 FL=1
MIVRHRKYDSCCLCEFFVEQVVLFEPHAGICFEVGVLGIFVGVCFAGAVATAVGFIDKECLFAFCAVLFATNFVYGNGHYVVFVVSVDAEAVVGFVAEVCRA